MDQATYEMMLERVKEFESLQSDLEKLTKLKKAISQGNIQRIVVVREDGGEHTIREKGWLGNQDMAYAILMRVIAEVEMLTKEALEWVEDNRRKL